GCAVVHLVVKIQLLRVGARANNVELRARRCLPAHRPVTRVESISLRAYADNSLRRSPWPFTEDAQSGKRKLRTVRRMHVADAYIPRAGRLREHFVVVGRVAAYFLMVHHRAPGVRV